jgi:hypothetical protein
MDPSSPIKKHFVLLPILYSGCNIFYCLLLSIYHYTTRADTASKEVARKVNHGDLATLAVSVSIPVAPIGLIALALIPPTALRQ